VSENEKTERTNKEERKTMKVEFNTDNYEFTHGRKPRGHGAWAFVPKHLWDNDLHWETGIYSEAKRKAKQFYANNMPAQSATLEIEVLS
jgi:hypothetical protein